MSVVWTGVSMSALGVAGDAAAAQGRACACCGAPGHDGGCPYCSTNTSRLATTADARAVSLSPLPPALLLPPPPAPRPLAWMTRKDRIRAAVTVVWIAGLLVLAA